MIVRALDQNGLRLLEFALTQKGYAEICFGPLIQWITGQKPVRICPPLRHNYFV